MSRNWLLYLDDLIASAEKIARLLGERGFEAVARDEAAFDAILFNLQVIGKAIKRLPDDRRSELSAQHQAGPARLRDLIAHHYFAVDAEIIFDVATRHVPALLAEARELRSRSGG